MEVDREQQMDFAAHEGEMTAVKQQPTLDQQAAMQAQQGDGK